MSRAAATRAEQSHIGRARVVIVGAGAAGTLVALHLARAAALRSTGLDVVLLDPADRWGRGVSFGTVDDQHLLNVPASGMSALPEDPGHFVSWHRRQHPLEAAADPGAFAPRREFGRYLDETLQAALLAAADHVSVRHVRARACGIRRLGDRVAITTSEGDEVHAEAAVIATGLPPGSWSRAWPRRTSTTGGTSRCSPSSARIRAGTTKPRSLPRAHCPASHPRAMRCKR